jgi:hypothetical protein
MLETLLTGILGGICGWFANDFIGKPLRRFYDLRSEVGRCLLYYGNVTARGRWVNAYQFETNDITPATNGSAERLPEPGSKDERICRWGTPRQLDGQDYGL